MSDGPDGISGYRHVWHSLQLKGHQVPRQVVETLLREMDPVEKESSAGEKKVIPWKKVLPSKRTSCRGKVSFAVRKKVLPWKRTLCREKVSFAVEKNVLP